MSDLHPSEDKAALYLLGGLSAAEQRDFETELAHSAELRALLRELEESSVLLAMSSPQRRPPTKVWQAIEKTVANEVKSKEPIPAFWTASWRNGWAAAAACLLGWLLYAFWINHHNPATTSTPAALSKADPAPEINSPGEIRNSPHSPNKTDAALQANAGDFQELIRLRRQVTNLQNRITNLSQFAAQQQALLGESNRLKFFQVTSASSNGGTAPPATLSPALQRALFIAMARELGWLPPTDPSLPGGNGNLAYFPIGTNGGNVDFMDLRQTTNGASATPRPQPNTQASSHTPESAPAPNPGPIAIPAFTSGNNVIVAIDKSIVPAGTQVNILDGDQQPLGTTTMGDNPVVFTVPTSYSGGPFYITTGGLLSPINFFQFFGSSTTNP